MTGRRGHFRIAKIRDTDVLVHWSFPVGGIIVALWGHVDHKQWLYYILPYACLVLIHEAGHAIAAAALGIRVFSIEISGAGGLCRIGRPRKVWHRVLVYSSGVIAQFILLLPAQAYWGIFGLPANAFGRATVVTFTIINLAGIVLNLIPYKGSRSLGTDGYVLWKIWRLSRRDRSHLPRPPHLLLAESPVFPPGTRLLSKPGFRPPGFVHGIEIFNDNATPMDFVVSALSRHLKISPGEALTTMFEIHQKGGLLIPLPSAQEAQNAAEAITAEARAAGHALLCRYADARLENFDK
jgi:ATP-dependent Clp protease adapter protein ClpS